MKKFCTKCGHEFEAVGREVICPSCKAAAAEETKRAAILKAKRASWTGESVPVRISGRASTVIRRYGTAHNLPFASALDALLKASDFLASTGKAWEEIEPYKSHRRDKSTATSTTQDAPQDVPQGVKQEVKTVKTVKTAAKATSKASASKAAAETKRAAVDNAPIRLTLSDAIGATTSKASASKASASKASKK